MDQEITFSVVLPLGELQKSVFLLDTNYFIFFKSFKALLLHIK